ncbi:MAG: DUF3990 domain-containing protein [Clostridium sp.]|nr:DUF3990 domain-containing protein [Clostridium sp.]
MLELSDGMLLYHGSYCEVKNPDLAKCASFKDFGKGFYLTSSKEQAKSFINTSLKKAKAQGIIAATQEYGVISTFRYHQQENINHFIFQEADDFCISRLILERLKDQVCFKTEAGLKCLSFMESEQIWKN